MIGSGDSEKVAVTFQKEQLREAEMLLLTQSGLLEWVNLAFNSDVCKSGRECSKELNTTEKQLVTFVAVEACLCEANVAESFLCLFAARHVPREMEDRFTAFFPVLRIEFDPRWSVIGTFKLPL